MIKSVNSPIKHRNDALSVAQELAMQGIRNQNIAFKIHSENLANAETTSDEPGGDPYTRKVVNLKVKNDSSTGAAVPYVDNIATDKKPFKTVIDPGHPSADENGVVKVSNVEPMIEMTSMMAGKENHQMLLRAYKMSSSMQMNQLDLMK